MSAAPAPQARPDPASAPARAGSPALGAPASAGLPRSGAAAPATRSQAQAQAQTQSGGRGTPARSGRPGRGAQRGQAKAPASSPDRLRIARGIAAAACLLPGMVGMVDIASAAGAPVASPTQTYADVRAHVARYEAEASLAAAPGSTGLGAATTALTDTSARIGSTALLYPGRSQELYALNDQLGARQEQLTTAWAARASTSPGLPAPSLELRDASAALTKPPNAASSWGLARVFGAGVLGVAVVLGVSIWLAPRTKRVINLGLVSGIVLTAGATALGVSVLAGSGAPVLVDDLAQVRAEAAGTVAAEASALQQGGSAQAAASARADHQRNAQQILSRYEGTTSDATPAWRTFTQGQLTQAQLGGGVTQSTGALVRQRIAALETLNGSLSQMARSAGEGADARPPLVAGYGVFALSLLAGAAAWAGVGRRLAEYR